MDKLFWIGFVGAVVAGLFAVLQAKKVMGYSEGTEKMQKLAASIREGANAYLKRQYTTVLKVFAIVFVVLLVIAFASGGKMLSKFTPFAFVTGGIWSMLAGLVGMKIATSSNARTAQAASESLNKGLRVAFSSGSVMGFTVVGLGMLDITIWFFLLRYAFGIDDPVQLGNIMVMNGMGASFMALFARVGGGIYTKAADVGADLVGKVEAGIPEDDPRNPATIADNVGDNVGDVAGMGADLYESYSGARLSAAALAVSSGAAAGTYTFLNLAKAGDHIVSAKTIYGGSYNLLAHTLPNFGITASFVDIHNLEEVEAAIQDQTRGIYVETLGNPNSDIPNLDALAELAHKHGLPLIVDNTFGTPYLIRPIEHGADIVVHSATKFLGGHGTTLGGVIVDSGKFDWEASGRYPAISEPNPSYHGVSFVKTAGEAAFVTYIRAILLRDTGAAISPFASFLLLQGIETLSLRLERHIENTKRVVEYLENHPLVEKVNHPSLPEHPDHDLYEKYFPNGGGSIFTFEIKGGVQEAHKFIDHLEIFSLLANVADVKSLVIHPATTTHSQLSQEELLDQGIRENTIRLSIGTEHIDDIIEDLDKGFQAVGGRYHV